MFYENWPGTFWPVFKELLTKAKDINLRIAPEIEKRHAPVSCVE